MVPLISCVVRAVGSDGYPQTPGMKMRELKHRSIIYFMRKGNVVAKVYDSPFVPPHKARVDVKDSQGNELNLVIVGNATYRFGGVEDMAKVFIDIPVLLITDNQFEETA
jgi:hypothetical protein